MTHLNDISKVYLEKVVYGGSDAKKEPKDDRHVVTNADKRGNTKAWQNYKAGDKRYRAADHVGESAVPGKPAERLGAVTAIPKSEQEAARERLLAKTKAKREAMKTEALDPVGQEDADVDNDGKKNTKSDEYLLKRRAAIKSAISGRKKKVSEAVHATAKQMHSPHEVPSGNLKGLVKKAVKRIDTDVDGDTDNNDKAKGELGEFIPGVGNKRLYSTTKTTTAKESFSNWRNDLREVVGEDDDVQIKEKNVKNKITINPKISEEVTILEMVEITEEQELQTLSHAVDFFFEEGINEDGLEMIIENLGLEDFVDLVYEIGYETLTEARTLLGKKKSPQKLPKGTSPSKATKAAVAKYGTTRRFKSSASSGVLKKKPVAAKAVETAKKEQPKKKPVRDAIAKGIFRAVDAYKAGMERHKAAMGAAKETGKTIAKAAAVTHEAGRRAGQSKVGQAVKKAGAAAIKAGVEKAKKDIKSLKKEEVEQLDEISDKKVQKVVNARNRRLNRSFDSGAPNKEFHQASKSNRLAARRNERTGSNVKVDSNLAKEEFVDEKLNMEKERMGDVIKDFYKSDAPQFKGKSKKKRRQMAIAAKLTAERGGRKLGESATEVAMSPQELALQKRKTQIDQMIAKKRQQSLQKARKSTNEEVEQVNEKDEKVEAEYKRAKTPYLLSKFRKENPGSRQEKKVPGAKETEGQAANRRRRAQAERAAKHGLTSKEKKETQARSEYYSSRD